MPQSSVAVLKGRDRRLPPQAPHRHLFGAFLFAFGFLFVCWVGLPTDFNSDHLTANLRGTQASGYGKLIRLTLDPSTPGWFYPASGLDMRFIRPLQFLWMKVYFDLFGSSLIPFHVTAAVGAGLLSMVFFWLIFRWTQSHLWAWLGVILYASFPSNYFMLTSTFSGDFQYFISILVLTSLLTFCKLTSEVKVSHVTFLVRLVLWMGCIWLAIKLKSSEKILPLICLAFLIWRSRSILTRIGWGRSTLLLTAILAMMVLVVPAGSLNLRSHAEGPERSEEAEEFQILRPSGPRDDRTSQLTQKDQTTFAFHWKNAFQRAFYVPDEDVPFATPYRKKLPRSLTGNYGFFLGWFFWVSILTTPWLIRRFPHEALRHEYWMTLVWFVATLAGFANGLTVQDTRFLNFAYVPSVLLLFLMTNFWEKIYFASKKRNFYFRLAVVAITLYTVVPNYGIYLKLLQHFGGIQDANVRTAQDLFQDQYGRKALDWELYETHHELETRFAVIDWYELPENWFEQALERLGKEGILYFHARGEDSERLKKFREAGYDPLLWKRYNFADATPLAFRLFKTVENLKQLVRGKVKRHEILVYKILPRA